MFNNFISMLGPWQWAAILAVPPAIVALYFLKLKREPLEVPSTYLWRKSIEDMHVNSIWQRLRQSLLLFLQLLLVLLAMLALLRPGWSGTTRLGDRSIFLVDNSASMAATDVEPTRLDDAKRRVLELIDQMESGAKAMIISFSDNAQVVQEFTDNRRLLRQRLETIKPTARGTTLLGALQLAAGLANPGRTAQDATDAVVADALPAVVYIFSDGNFEGVEGFSRGNLEAKFIPIGDPAAGNVAITAFNTRRHETRPGHRQAFARLTNFGNEDVTLTAELYLDDELIDADDVTIEVGGNSGIVFDLGEVPAGQLRLRVRTDDALVLDDVAYAALNAPRRSRVLFVSPGNEAIDLVLSTGRALLLTDVERATPEELNSKPYKDDASSGAYDLIIYDQCRPEEMPRSNTLFVGRLPPDASWKGDQEPNMIDVPLITDTDRTHPLMQLVDLGNVDIAESIILDPPPGSTSLVGSDQVTIAAIGPREGFEDVVLGFEIIGTDESGSSYQNTNWISRASFPTFWLAVIEYLAGGGQSDSSAIGQPGRPVQLSSQTPVDSLTIEAPDGQTVSIERASQLRFQFHGTDQLGVYRVFESGEITQRFAVNLFNPVESNVAPRPEGSIQIGYIDVKGQVDWEPARKETWKFLLLLALAVLLFEWYIYNRRVYI